MKACFKCGITKPLNEFYAHKMMADGYLNKCKECTKKDVKDRYYSKPEAILAYDAERSQRPERKAKAFEYQRKRRALSPLKNKARQDAGNAIRDGRLIPQPCEACGTTENVQAHHDDYSKPLEVRWLCFEHHRKEHGQLSYRQTAS